MQGYGLGFADAAVQSQPSHSHRTDDESSEGLAPKSWLDWTGAANSAWPCAAEKPQPYHAKDLDLALIVESAQALLVEV